MLTREQVEAIGQLANSDYRLSPDGSCANRLAHASKDIRELVDTDAALRAENARLKEFPQLVDYAHEVQRLRKQLATMTKERDELIHAARRASWKMHIEYRHHQPDAVKGECWSEVEELDCVLQALTRTEEGG